MTEYGVQTNNIFDLLNAAEDPAKTAGGAAKPKARKKKSQRGKGGAASGQPQGQTGSGQPKKESSQTGAPAKPPTQQRPPSAQPRGTTVTVSGGRGAVPRAQGGNAPSPVGGRGNNQGGGRGSPNQGGARPQAPRAQLARGTEEFVRRHDESHVSFNEEPKSKPDTTRHPDEDRKHHQTGPARGREFERHSGTGRSPTENKKGGAGQANWGKLDASDELAGTEDAQAELQAENPEAKKDEQKKKKKKKGKKQEEEKEEEKKDEIPDEQLKTLDDFLKEKSSKAVKLALPPARAAGEGVKIDPKWAEAVKREDSEEVFVKPKEEPKKEDEQKKPSKSSLRKKRKKEAKEQQAKKLAEENIVNMFDFSAKKENEFPRGGRGRGRGPREGGPRPPREGGSGRGPREGGARPPREGGGRGRGGPRGNQQPRKYTPGAAADQGAQFDDSAFPALQVGPPPITVD